MPDTPAIEFDPSEVQELEPKVVIPQVAPGQPNRVQLAAQNNNPGNIRYAGQPGATPGAGGFARFNTPEEGLNDIHRLITEHSTKGHTLSQYISTYAPPSENDTANYIAQAAKELGVKPETPLMYVDPDKLAALQARIESSSTVGLQPKPIEFDPSEVKEFSPDEVKSPAPAGRVRRDEGMGVQGRSRPPVQPGQTGADVLKQLAATPAMPFSRLFPEEPTTIAGGVAKGAAQFAEGMTTPENLALMFGTGGLGDIARALPLAKTVTSLLPRAVSAVFGFQMLKGAYDSVPAVKKAWDEGNAPKVAEEVTKLVAGGTMGALAAGHAARIVGDIGAATEAHNLEATQRVEAERNRQTPVASEAGIGTVVEGTNRPMSVAPDTLSPQGDVARHNVLDPETGEILFQGDSVAVDKYLKQNGAKGLPGAQGNIPAAKEGAPEPESPTGEAKVGVETELPSGKYTPTSIDKGIVTYDVEGAGGDFKGKKMPLARYNKMIAAAQPAKEFSPDEVSPAPAPPEQEVIPAAKPTEAVPEPSVGAAQEGANAQPPQQERVESSEVSVPALPETPGVGVPGEPQQSEVPVVQEGDRDKGGAPEVTPTSELAEPTGTDLVKVTKGTGKETLGMVPLEVRRAGLEPMNDIKRNPTGWLQMPLPDGVALVHPSDDHAIRFEAKNPRSGTDVIRAKAEAQVYAIDNPLVAAPEAPAPQGDGLWPVKEGRKKPKSKEDLRSEFDAAVSAYESAAPEDHDARQEAIFTIINNAQQLGVKGLPMGANGETAAGELIQKYKQAIAATAPPKIQAGQTETPTHKEGDRVIWASTNGKRFSGTIRNIDTEEGTASIDTDQIATIGGRIPIGRIETVKLDRLQPEKPAAKEEEAPPAPKAEGASGLANEVYKKLSAGESLGNVTELNKLSEKHFGASRTSGEWTPKDAFDAMEVGINKHLHDIGKDLMEGSAEEGLAKLKELEQKVTSQGTRTEEQDKFQQFSTPPRESFVVAKVADLKPTDIVLEPSAGNGGIAVWPKAIGATVHVNEISDRRREMLDLAGFGKATAHDGEIINALLDPSIRPTVILMNPPFSAGGAKSGPAKNNNQYGFNHLDSALQRLAPGGRLVAILGGGRADDMNGGATLLGGPSGKWFTDIAKRYNVRANIRVNGKEYQKYGTSFATRIIVIDKDGPTPSRVAPTPSWDSVVRGNADTLEEAYTLLSDVAGSRPEIAPGTEGAVRPGENKPTTAQGGDRGRPSGGTRGQQPSGAGVGGPSAVGEPGRSPGVGEGNGPGDTGESASGGEPRVRPEGPPETTAAGSAQGSTPDVPGKLTRQQLIDATKKKFAETRGLKPPTPAAEPETKPVPVETKAPSTQQAAAKKAADEAAARMRDRMSKRNIQDEPVRFSIEDGQRVPKDIDPDDLIDLATMGAGHIVDGSTTFPEWVEKMNSAVGDMVEFAAANASLPVDDVLRQVYDLASAVAEDYGAKAEPAPPAVPEEAAQQDLTGNEENVPMSLERNMLHESDKEDSTAYVEYQPSVKGPKHPGSIVETKTMSTVPLPPITYKPNLPQSVMDKGTISAVQLEAIALAGQQNSTILPDGSRSMLLIGDGTGVGKGREAAGILWDNFRQGRKRLVWMSQNWDLMQDAIRDLNGIGADEMTKGNERNASGTFTTNGSSFVQPMNKFKADVKIKHQGLIFSTHALARSVDKKGNRRIKQMEEYLRGDDDGEGAVIIIDEAHNLKNAVVAGRGQPSLQGKAVKELLGALPKLRVTALSATAATEVMNLGWMDRLGLWGPGTPFPSGFNEFAGQIAGGRLAAMEMIATELKAQGKYVARTLSFKGVSYAEEEHVVTDDQKAIYRTAAKAWKKVFEAAGNTIANTTKGGSKQKANFNQAAGGAQQRFFGTLITALKTPTAIELANKAIDAGKSVVITMVNTGEAAQEREKNRVAAGRTGDEEEDDIPEYDFGPKQMLIDLVRENYPVQQYSDDVDDNGNPIKVPVTSIDADGREIPVNNPQAVAERDALIAEIDRDLHMPENPLDILINSLGGGAKVAELTGRKERFDASTGKFVPRGDPGMARKNVNISEMRNFQTGKKRIAVLTGAANAGISLHSSLDSPNQQQRYHITLQVGWSADKAMQMMGRTHRTNQAHPPEYVMLVSDLGGEKRFISTISRRLGSLGALTKGQKNATSGTDLMEKVNFETVEGRAAATAFYEQLLRNEVIPGTGLTGMQVLHDLRMLSGQPPTVKQADRANVTKLLNRLMALDPDVQNNVYNYFYDIFQATVQRAIEAGTLDTGVKTLPGDEFQVKESRVIARDPKTGAQTLYYPVDAKVRNNRVSLKDLEKRMAGHEDEHPTLRVNEKTGKVSLSIDADPIVHASGSIEEALYVSAPDRGKWIKVAKNRTEYSHPAVEEIAKRKLETAERELHGAKRAIEYAKQDLSRAYSGTWAQSRLDSAEKALPAAQLAYDQAKEMADDPQKWAKEEWDRQYDAAPSHTTEPYHLVGRAVMSYWNAISDASHFADIFTTTDSKTGQRVVGVSIPADAIGNLLQRITGGGTTVNAHQLIVDTLQNGLSYTLEGGIQVRRTRIGREAVIQMVPPSQDVAKNLQAMGLVFERGVVPVYYVPNGQRDSVVSRVLDQYPVQPNEPPPDDPNGPARLSREVPGFYSQLQRVVTEKMPSKTSVEQATAIIKNPNNGVKADEIKWSGIEDWLKEQKGGVSKQEVLDFLKANDTKLVEVSRGATPRKKMTWTEEPRENPTDIQAWKSDDGRVTIERTPHGFFRFIRDGGMSLHYDSLADAQAAAEQSDRSEGPAKYANYVTPGGSNYRELLLTLPPDLNADAAARSARVKELIARRDELQREIGAYDRTVEDTTDLDAKIRNLSYWPSAPGVAKDPKDQAYLDQLGKEWGRLEGLRQELQDKRRQLRNTETQIDVVMKEPSGTRVGYKSSHWEEPNVLAHIRMDDRVGPHGEQILHVNEIQSDWHQAGKRKGYEVSGVERSRLLDERVALEDEWNREAGIYTDKITDLKWGVPDASGERDYQAMKRGTPEWIETMAEISRAERARNTAEAKVKEIRAKLSAGVPAAPFAKTWPELAFKRVLRYAAENGYDAVTWDTGETQADRYDLSKQVESVAARKWGETGVANRQRGKYALDVKLKDGGRLEREDLANLSEAELADTIGKDLAEKIVAETKEGGDWKTYSGLDLKVGGEGMKGFYDKILVDFANKYGKKWGAKVSDVTLPGSGGRTDKSDFSDEAYITYNDAEDVFDVHGSEGEILATFGSEGQANEYLNGMREEAKSSVVSAHSIPITPAMRESVMQGQPLFARGKIQAGQGIQPSQYRNGILWVGSQTMKQIVNALGGEDVPAGMMPGGIYLPPAAAVKLKNVVTNGLGQAIAEALADKRSLVIVLHDQGTPISQAIERARHELFHAAEEWSGNGNRGKQLLEDPLARKAKEGLLSQGYSSDDAMIFSEIGAHLASGPVGWERMGISKEEAPHLFRAYAALLSDAVVSNLSRITPQLKQELYAEQAIRQSTLSVEPGDRQELPGTLQGREGGETGRSLQPVVPRLSREGERGSTPIFSDIAKSLKERFGEEGPKANYSGLGAMQSRYIPGGNLSQIEKANTKVHTAAIRAASDRAQAMVILRQAIPQMKKALQGGSITMPEVFLTMIESRLQGLQQRWEDFAKQAETMSDEDLEKSYTEAFANLLGSIAGKKDIAQDVEQTAAALIEVKDWEGLRGFLASTFQDAAASVTRVMEPVMFEDVTADPHFQAALKVYKDLVEAPLAENHSINEGIFSDALGPLDTYYPLISMERDISQGPGRRLPYRKPKNIANRFATGLSEGYDPGVEALRDRIAAAVRANDKAALLEALKQSGILKPLAHNAAMPESFKYQGEEYEPEKVELSPGKILIQGGKATPTKATYGVMPRWAAHELRPILERTPGSPKTIIDKFIQALNTITLTGVAEPVFHASNLLGTMIANTPFLENSLGGKLQSAPFIKKFAAIYQIAKTDPTTEQATKELIEMSKLGLVPERYASITYSKKAAEELAATQKKLSLAPILFGPKGIDIRARLVMYRLAKSINPEATPQELYHFVNQLGNYVPALQSEMERAMKRTGFSPFITAGSTMLKNGINAWTGGGPMPKSGPGMRIWQQLTGGGLFMLGLWAWLYKETTGKWPWEDRRAKLMAIPAPDKVRKSPLGQAMWGKGPETGYINLNFFNPLLNRGARAFGAPSAFEAHAVGGNFGQQVEAAQKDMMNAFAQPFEGPPLKAAFVAATGQEPYVTGLRDVSGRVGIQLFPMIPPKTKPGWPSIEQRGIAAAKEINSFYGATGDAIGQSTGFLGADEGKKGNHWLHMVTDYAFPGLFGAATNPYAKETMLRKQRQALR